MAPKRGLGTGLDNLIPKKQVFGHNDVNAENIKEVNTIDINKIEPGNTQPRKNFNEDSLQELADSVKQYGIIQPLIVQKGSEGFYQIIAGERRWRAAKIAGLKEIPVILRECSNQQIIEIALIENIQREDLNPIEEAQAFERLIEEYHLKQDEIAEKVSKSRVAITNALRLLKLDERVREMIIADQLKSGHARALLAIEDGELQYETAVQVFDKSLSVRETEKLVKKLLNENIKRQGKKIEEDEQLNIVYAGYEEKLKSIIGTKVNINRNKNGKKGKIEIEYYSPEDFERIMDLMVHIGK